ncbi:hypothetical protein DCAR_0416360 [Daucus carota subsp. sativus]|uniref:Uncharacterized protein n=1 Tax=Daucus carota subsp. sativus TaxID=79200 RepID=A0A162A9K6_DAUCS|nr:hypothetical protein DCAR_0416360 [Daucus carota subsp. sativus]
MGRLSTEIEEGNKKSPWTAEGDLVLASHFQKPGLGSPVSMAPVPLLSSSLMSLKPPRGWSQNASHQQPMNHTNNHQLCNQTASQITEASSCSEIVVPYVFNIDNVAKWLQNWNSETLNSKSDNVGASNPPPLPPPVGLDVFSGDQQEIFLPAAEVATATSSGWQNKDDRLSPLKMPVLRNQDHWPFF